MKKYPHGITSAIFILTAILFCLKAPLMMTDTDFWWHLSAGNLIRQSGGIPAHDVFSFTAGNYPWLNISWLWDVFYSFLVGLGGGYWLPLLLTAVINALALAVLTGFILQRGAGPVVTLVTLLLGILPYSYMLTPRPHQVTFLFTVVFYVLAHNASAQKSLKPLITLPLLMIIWVNIHGGFIVGLIIIGAYLLQSFLYREWPNFRNFAVVFVCCLLALLVNPLGIHIFEACNRTLSSALIPIISEWRALQLDAQFLPNTGYVFLFLITFNILNPRTGLAEKLLSLMWVVEAIKHERNLPIFVLLSAPVFALNLKQMISGRLAVWVNERDEKYHKDFANPKVKKAVFYLALIMIVVLFSGVGKVLINTKIPVTHPFKEVAYFKDHFEGRRILNDYSEGGFLLYHLNDSSKIYIDGRAETAYPAEVVQDYLKYFYTVPGWEKMVEKYQIDAAIIPKSDSKNNFFIQQGGWQKVFAGPLDNVYVKH